MEEVLSQAEIDELLKSLTSGGPPQPPASETRKERVRPYDFKRALRLSKEQLRSLNRLNEHFARLLSTAFSAALRTYVHVTLAAADQVPFEEYVLSAPKFTVVGVFTASPLKGRFLVEFSPTMAFSMLDRYLGGPGLAEVKESGLTEIETRILEMLFQRTGENFREAWQSLADLDVHHEAIETNPQFLQIASPNDIVVVFSFQVKVGETTTVMNVVLPHFMLEPLMPKLSARHMLEGFQEGDDQRPSEEIKARLAWTWVPIRVILGQTALRFADVLRLEVGDVIRLGTRIDEPLIVKLGDRDAFVGRPGISRGRVAVRIEGILPREE
ncbi:MAG: flagellar motor switch protein FliM [Brockia lithotrophica]|nr:flagellar motor switch protein FliM [Brockia lithotrophica]